MIHEYIIPHSVLNNEYLKSITETQLTDGRYYVYILENYPQKNIKVGITKNPKQRFKSLGSSNGGGNKISRIAISEPTYMRKLESIMHDTLSKYRVPNTEWFSGIGYHEAVQILISYLSTDIYKAYNKKACTKM